MATWRWQSILVCGCWLLASQWVYSSAQAQTFDRQYDIWFEGYAVRYLYGLLPENDWRWFKAQCYQESRLKAGAVSPAGAAGLCQLMPGAAADAGLSPTQRFDPEKNIKAGAIILRRNIRVWRERDTRFHRLQLGWAGYNAGAGWIVKAQSLCGGPALWEFIAPCLHRVTGHHALETIRYVAIIPSWYQGLVHEHPAY
jgi:membrane-bound lytic murein transglycosylase MltF